MYVVGLYFERHYFVKKEKKYFVENVEVED